MATLIKILQLAQFRFTQTSELLQNHWCLTNPLIPASNVRLLEAAEGSSSYCQIRGLLQTSPALADCSARRRHKHINHFKGLWSRLLLPNPDIYSVSSKCAWRSLVTIRVEKHTGHSGHRFSKNSGHVFKGLGCCNFLFCRLHISSGEPELWR